MFKISGLNEKYVCILCGERMRRDTALLLDGKIGVCRACYAALCQSPPSQPFEGVGSVSYLLSPFEYTGGIRRAIIDFKFNGQRSYAGLLSRLMYEYLDSFGIWDGFDMLIPVPLHPERLNERGYNQSELLCAGAAEHIGIPMRTDVLLRVRATKKQSTLSMRERTENVRDAFSCSADVKDKRILIFDDICTTGNTLRFCAGALNNSGAGKICALTLARTFKKELPDSMY